MLVTGNVVGRQSFREKLAWNIVKCLQPLYLLLRMKRDSWGIKKEDLAKFDDYTLGKEMYEWLNKNEYEIIPKVEFHDVYHVLFGYDNQMKNEASIQFCVVGNGKVTLPYLASCAVALVLFPEFWREFKAAYWKGRNAKKFYHLDWKQHLAVNLNELQESIF